jgi:hypothetical protein
MSPSGRDEYDHDKECTDMPEMGRRSVLKASYDPVSERCSRFFSILEMVRIRG